MCPANSRKVSFLKKESTSNLRTLSAQSVPCSLKLHRLFFSANLSCLVLESCSTSKIIQDESVLLKNKGNLKCSMRSESNFQFSPSHAIVSRTPSPLGYHPVDILTRVLYVTSLAMNTVLCVDLQPHTISILPGNIFIHPRRAKPLLGAVVNREVPIDRYGIVPQG